MSDDGCKLKWLPFELLPADRKAQYPIRDGDGQFNLAATWRSGISMLEDTKVVEHHSRPICSSVAPDQLSHYKSGILAVSINVQSLRGNMKGDDSRKMIGKKKVDITLDQLSERGVHVFWAQEVRDFNSRKRLHGEYIYCTSAADKIGGHGCAVGIHTKLPWAMMDVKPCKVKLDDVTILLAEPRLIIVSVCTVGVDCIVVSCHGPLAASTDVGITDHWKYVCAKIVESRLGRPVILLCDANAALTLGADACIGELLDKVSNAATRDFTACLMSADLWVPSSFERYGGVVRGTSYSKIGANLARRDYCVVSQDVAILDGSAGAWYDFTMPNRGKDHVPTFVKLHLPLVGAEVMVRRRVPGYNRVAVRIPSRVLRFKQLLAEIPVASLHCGVEPGSHTAIVDDEVRAAAVVAFGEHKKTLRTTQDYITSVTREWISTRRSWLSWWHKQVFRWVCRRGDGYS